MPEFHHSIADGGWVSVRGDNGTYSDTVENFLADFGQPLPELENGATEHIYTQGKRHCMQNAESVVWGGPIEGYEYGDAAIAALPDLMAKYRARELQKEAEAKAKFEADVAAADAERAARQAGTT